MSFEKKCIVTGGAGFIGSHLVERLLADGHRVVAVDNLSNSSLANLDGPLRASNDRFSFVNADMADQESVEFAFRGAEWVFHLAALADIVPSITEPMKYFRSNVVGTSNAVEVSRQIGVKRFLYAASGSCYGIPDIFPTPETAPIRPEYPYALTKNLGEQLCLHWNKVYGLPSVALRLGNVYGPRSRTSGTYGAVFGVFLAQKINGMPFTVVGDGTQVRDFTFVTDVVDAFVCAAQSDFSGEVFNVGTGEPQSVNRLVELLGGPVVRIPKRPGEPDRTHVDISKIRRVLGWSPKVSFEDGVAKILEHLGDWRQAPVWTPETIAENTAEWFERLGDKQ